MLKGHGVAVQTALFGVWVVEFLAFVGLIVGISLKQSRVMAGSGWSSSAYECMPMPCHICAGGHQQLVCPARRPRSGSLGTMSRRSPTSRLVAFCGPAWSLARSFTSAALSWRPRVASAGAQQHGPQPHSACDLLVHTSAVYLLREHQSRPRHHPAACIMVCRSMRRKRVTQKCMVEHTIVVRKVLQLACECPASTPASSATCENRQEQHAVC